MRRRLGWWAAAPVGLAILLIAPTFSFTYLYDDYDFLGRAQQWTPARLLPDAETLFYRPISRELYFGLLYRLDPNRPEWGHVGNTALLAVAVGLLAGLAARLAGPAAGLYAGLLYASLGVLPILAGWASGAQDLFAIVFVLAALHAALSGRLLLSVTAAAAALLSKETAAAFLPAVALLPMIAGRKRSSRGPAAFGLLAVAWGALHPGVRFLLTRGFESGEGAPYVTAATGDRLGALFRGVATLFNYPVSGPATPWPGERTGLWIAASVVTVATALLFGKAAKGSRGAITPKQRGGAARAPETLGLGPIALFAGLLTLPALALISLLLRQWQPYYLALPAVGTTLFLGAALSRLPAVVAAVPLVVFLAAGVWCRGMSLGSDIPSERNVVEPMARLRAVEEGVRTLWPEVEGPTDVALSVHAPETPEVSLHLFRFQVLRMWYRNPAIDTVHPERRRPSPPSERLAWISRDLSAHEIDPRTLATRSSGPPPDSSEMAATIRSYALGLAACGETARGASLLLELRPRDEFEGAVNRRLAAALWIAEGKADSAEALLRKTPSLERQDGLYVAAGLLSGPTRRDIDVPVLTALGVAPEDTAAIRLLMRRFALQRSGEAATRFAQRLLVARPGDWEATSLLRWFRQGKETRRVTIPVVADSLW